MLVPIDIETIPQQPADKVRAAIAETIQAPSRMSDPKTLSAWHSGEGKYAGAKEAEIENQYRATALDGAKGQIFSVSWAIEYGVPKNIMAIPGGMAEADLLDNFFTALREDLAKAGNGRPPFFAGHYLEFDLPYLFQRAVVNRVNPGLDLCQYGRHGRDFFDTMVAWAGYKGRISLDNLCAALGIDVPSPEGLTGATIWDFYQAGKFDEIREYNNADILKVQGCTKRLRFE